MLKFPGCGDIASRRYLGFQLQLAIFGNFSLAFRLRAIWLRAKLILSLVGEFHRSV